MKAKKIISFLIISCITLISCEMILRVVGFDKVGGREYMSPFRVYRDNHYFLHKSNESVDYSVAEFTFSHKTNEHGMIGAAMSKEKTNKVRIIVIGDSFTEGVGAPPDSSYPVLLQNIFDSVMPNRVEVMNAGLCGSDPVYEYKFLKDSFSIYKPDIVVLNILSGDIRDLRVRGCFERFKDKGEVKYKTPPPIEPLFINSVLFREVATKFFRYDYLMTPASYVRIEEEMAISCINSTLDSFKTYCDESNYKLLVVFNPVALEIEIDKLELGNSLSYAEKINLATLDLLEGFIKKKITKSNVYEYFWPLDFHNNSNVYKLYAECVYEKLVSDFPDFFSE